MSDGPNTADLLHTVLTVSHGNINVDTTTGVTIVGGASGSSSVTLSGTAAQITAALASTSTNYTGTLNYYGPDSLSVTTTDTVNNATSATKTVAIQVADTTTVSETVPTSTLAVNENAALSLSGISVSDGPNTADLLHTVLTVSHGNINVDTTTGVTIVGGASGSSSVTLSGTAAQITAALAEHEHELHRHPQLLRPRQPVGDHDRHSQQRHFGNEDGGDPGRRYDDGVGDGAYLDAGRQRERRALAERDFGVGWTEHRRHCCTRRWRCRTAISTWTRRPA